jgi:hypothetical protein
MTASVEFVLGLLDQHNPACAAWEDFESEHGQLLRQWQRRGFIVKEPEQNPVPSCPYCREGVPYRISERYLCPECQSVVDVQHLLLWRFDHEAFLRWLASALKLTGGIRPVDATLWQLGSLGQGDLTYECFFRRGQLSDHARTRLLAFRNAVLLQGLPGAKTVEGFHGPCLSLVEVIQHDRRSTRVTDLALLLRSNGAVRFHEQSGALFAGDRFLGEVPIDTKEYYLVARLWQECDRFVAYGDLKHFVLRQTGSSDTTDEATFCHKLKGRIKDRGWVPKIDSLIATTNKGDGYRLRGYVESDSSTTDPRNLAA